MNSRPARNQAAFAKVGLPRAALFPSTPGWPVQKNVSMKDYRRLLDAVFQAKPAFLPGFVALLLIPMSFVHAAGGSGTEGSVTGGPIDRHALVTRHNISWSEPKGQIPLGNGEFCFNADATGLQTFGGNTMAHWAWHSFPLPPGWTSDQVPATGTFQHGRNTGPDVFPEHTDAIRTWMFDNPHSMNLGRLRLCRSDGVELRPEEISSLTRTMDLWSGVQTSAYQIDGVPVHVRTFVLASQDAVAVRIESPFLARGALAVVIDFPYPSLENRAWVGDFGRLDRHNTEMTARDGVRADFRRTVDDTSYYTSLAWSPGGALRSGNSPHRFFLSAADANVLEFTCAFSREGIYDELPPMEASLAETSTHWDRFWRAGGAIDLSGSADPRWSELERRIVLSQYLMAAQSAGSYPSAETGLMGLDPWRGQFHMEMLWWHLAHYALWGRWPMAEEALGCYQRFEPGARALAAQLGYKGLKWPKSVGPEGRSAPWIGNQVLLWKQPHPIFFAELEYRLRPTRATLEQWADIVQGTAEHMADYPTRDEETGVYSLAPVMPPSEQGITRDTVFDLAYWRWGLEKAQEWRERLGRPREPHWDEVRTHLAPLPEVDGVFVHSAEWRDTYTTRAWEHPDPIGVLGMLPPVDGVDPETAHRTVQKVWESWDWNRCWGWDFPWMAMAAARCGEPGIAVEALLKEAGDRNHYDIRGMNTGGPCPYLPGNGGLLYAVAMMAAGWDGAPDYNAPGFPADGRWSVKWEGLQRAP